MTPWGRPFPKVAHGFSRAAIAALKGCATRAGLRCTVAAIACVTVFAKEPVLLRDPKTKDLFAAARIAIFGGPGGIARLHSLRFKGRSRFRGTNDDLLSATVEIRVILPDHYLRVDSGSFGRRIGGPRGREEPRSHRERDGARHA